MTKSRVLKFMTTLIMPIVGVLCILFPEPIARYLPYVMGGAMILLGGVHIALRFTKAVQRRDTPRRTDVSFVIFILGIVIVIMGGGSLNLIGIVWGLYGLWQSCYSFQKGVTALHNREKFVLHFVICIVRLAIALLLLFDPMGAFEHHIVILGIDILIDTIKGPHSHKMQREDGFFHRLYADNDDLIPKHFSSRAADGENLQKKRDRLDIFHDIGAENDDSDLRAAQKAREAAEPAFAAAAVHAGVEAQAETVTAVHVGVEISAEDAEEEVPIGAAAPAAAAAEPDGALDNVMELFHEIDGVIEHPDDP